MTFTARRGEALETARLSHGSWNRGLSALTFERAGERNLVPIHSRTCFLSIPLSFVSNA